MKKLALIIFQFISIAFIAQPKPSYDSLFLNGYYFEGIDKYTIQLKKEKNDFNKAQLFQKIADCYYYSSYIDKFKSNIDSSRFYYTKYFKKDNIYDVVYQINLIKYYNFIIKVKEAYAVGLKAKQELLKYPKIKFYKLYEVIGTNYRNHGETYEVRTQIYDSAYYYLKKENLVNTFDEVIYCRARANMELDFVTEKALDHLKNATIYFDKGIAILQKMTPNNYVQLSVFYCLKGLAGNMAHQYELSDSMFTKAYYYIDKCNKTSSDFRNYQSLYLNIVNWSSWTTSALYSKTKNINYVYTQLNKLLNAEKIYRQFASTNKIKEGNYFRDTYNYAPYNSIISYYYDIYSYTKNDAYIDSALKYSELNKTQWYTTKVYINELNNSIKAFTNDSTVVINYSEYGFQSVKKIYAIVCLNNKKHFVQLPTTKSFDEFPYYYDVTKITQQQYNNLSYSYYEKLFKPLLSIIPKSTKKILLIPSGTFSYINFEGIITDTSCSIKKVPFLFKTYNILQQPSLTLFFNSNKTTKANISHISLLCPNYSKSDYGNIKYTSSFFNTWSDSYVNSKFDLSKNKGDVLLISAHCKSSTSNADNSYIQLPDSNLNIAKICNAHLHNKLTILAMCDGGFGENIRGSGNYSFSSAFIMAGTESCLYSIWKLEDKTASVIIADFLKNLEQGQSKDMALRNAKLAYLNHAVSSEEYRPMYWASLQIVGNINPLVFKPKTSVYWWLLLFPLLIGIVLIRVRLKS